MLRGLLAGGLWGTIVGGLVLAFTSQIANWREIAPIDARPLETAGLDEASEDDTAVSADGPAELPPLPEPSEGADDVAAGQMDAADTAGAAADDLAAEDTQPGGAAGDDVTGDSAAGVAMPSEDAMAGEEVALATPAGEQPAEPEQVTEAEPEPEAQPQPVPQVADRDHTPDAAPDDAQVASVTEDAGPAPEVTIIRRPDPVPAAPVGTDPATDPDASALSDEPAPQTTDTDRAPAFRSAAPMSSTASGLGEESREPAHKRIAITGADGAEPPDPAVPGDDEAGTDDAEETAAEGGFKRITAPSAGQVPDDPQPAPDAPSEIAGLAQGTPLDSDPAPATGPAPQIAASPVDEAAVEPPLPDLPLPAVQDMVKEAAGPARISGRAGALPAVGAAPSQTGPATRLSAAPGTDGAPSVKAAPEELAVYLPQPALPQPATPEPVAGAAAGTEPAEVPAPGIAALSDPVTVAEPPVEPGMAASESTPSVPADPGSGTTRSSPAGSDGAPVRILRGGASGSGLPGQRVGRLPTVSGGSGGDDGALSRNAMTWSAPEGVSLLSVVLTGPADAAPAGGAPAPLTFAVDGGAPGAADAAGALRAAGYEVVLRPGLNTAADPADIARNLTDMLAALDVAVAMIDVDGAGFQGDRVRAAQVVSAARQEGLGLVTSAVGYNAARSIAGRFSVPFSEVSRVLPDGAGRLSVHQALDRAALEARGNGHAVVTGQASEEVIAAILSWAEENSGSGVVLAPLSAALLAAR